MRPETIHVGGGARLPAPAPARPPVPRTRLASAAWAGLMAALVALAACGRDEPAREVVARVGDAELTVQEVADYMMGGGRGVTEEEVERAVEEMIDLELTLQRARARHALSAAESLRIKEMQETALINQFREDVVWQDVQVDEAELRTWYEENVGEEARARHVLIQVSPSASEEEKARARGLADSLHQAVSGGADFAEVARRHSQDAGSASRGGMLGWFGRGQMVQPFEEAVFATPAGRLVPNVVETPFGFHVIRVEEKRKRSFEDLRDEIEEQLAGPARQEAEQAYVTRMMETSAIEFYEDHVDSLIGMIDADRAPSSVERDLDLATFTGGALGLGEVWDIYDALPESNRRAIGQLDQAGMIQALAPIAQQRMLLARAREAGIEPDTVRQDQLERLVDALYLEAYLRGVAEARIEVPDSVAHRYYEEHREFYEGRAYEDVADQIREVLRAQRMEGLRDQEAQRRLIEAVADSQAARVEVVRYPEKYDDVVDRLKEMYAEEGAEPPATAGVAPAGAGAAGGADAP